MAALHLVSSFQTAPTYPVSVSAAVNPTTFAVSVTQNRIFSETRGGDQMVWVLVVVLFVLICIAVREEARRW